MKKTLYLMRHGQTLFNVRRKIQGWCDSPLTEIGIKQAGYARKYFLDHNIVFDSAYSSTSERACDTLELVTDLNYKRLKGIKEWNFGTFEAESEDLNPKLPYGEFFVAFNGESEKDLEQRLVTTITDVMNQDRGETILMVSHGASCAVFSRAFKEYSKIGPISGLKNCCILKFEFEDNVFSLVEFINHDFVDLG